MKYHVVPTPKNLKTIIDPNLQRAVRELNREMLGSVAKLSKHGGSDTSKDLVYLFDRASINKFVSSLMDGDEIILHAEGQPFTIGPIELSPYSLRPFQLADMLFSAGLPNATLSITLMSCNSATDFHGSNYARDLCRALYFCFQYSDITVNGYTGFINVKDNGKFSVSKRIGCCSEKKQHYSLAQAQASYHNGVAIGEIKTVIESMSGVVFSWAELELNSLLLERQFIENKAISKQAMQSLYSRSASSFLHWQGPVEEAGKVTDVYPVAALLK